MTDTNYYGEHAYRSDRIPPMPAQTYGYSVLGYQRLPWGNTLKDGLPHDMNRASVLKIEDEKIRLDRYGLNIPKEVWGFRNHEYIEDANVALSSTVLIYGYAIGKLMAWPFTILAALCFIAMYFGMELTKQEIQTLIKAMFVFPGILFYMWGGFKFLYYKKPELFTKKGRGPKWRFNRRTGMVTQWIYPQTPDEPIKKQEFPFTHLDAYILKLMTQGGMLYNILLHNRYTNTPLPLNNFVSDSSEMGVVEYWDFLQNYMDVSRPLPDYTVLEFYRHLDPVTAEYDKQTGRNPRQFRDLTKEQWKTFDKLFPRKWDDYRVRECAFQQGGYVDYLPAYRWYPQPAPKINHRNEQKG